MKKILAMILATAVTAGVMTSTANAGVFVNGYFKNNGTYVQPHYRTNPDGYLFNNYSYWD